MVLRFLLRNWLQQAAHEKLRETVSAAAREGLSAGEEASASRQASQADPHAVPACHVGVVFALSIESGGLEDLLGNVVATRGHGFTAKQGRYGKLGTVLIEAGAGLQAAARATEALIAGHRPAWVISAGFAGGLSRELKRFDIVIANSIVDEAGNRLTLNLKGDLSPLAQQFHVHIGPLACVDRVLQSPDEKRLLGEASQALAVDMESYAVADVCRQRQVQFLAIRVISDPWDEQLPGDIERLVRQKTNFSRLGAAVGAVWQRPGSLKDMYQLRENSLVASDRLAKLLVWLMPQLPPASERS